MLCSTRGVWKAALGIRLATGNSSVSGIRRKFMVEMDRVVGGGRGGMGGQLGVGVYW